MEPHRWSGDVIIVGAGPAGCACATFLSRAGRRVLLIDRTSSRWKPVEVLAPATVQLLRYHRLIDSDLTQKYGTCRGVHGLWDRQPGFFDYQLFACDAGVAVDRSVFDRDLLAPAVSAGTHFLPIAVVHRATQAADGSWTLELSDADGRKVTVSARLLIHAGGRAATTLRPARIDRQYFDRLIAIACRVTLSPSPVQIMLLEADEEGWWYSSSDATGHGAVVYLSDADLLPRTPEERASFFRRRFASSRLLRQHLPPLPDVLDLRLIDARTSRVRHFCTRASLSIGDAAYAVDPLSGSGIRRAVESAIAASDAVNAFLVTGDARTLDGYDGWATAEFQRWLDDKDGVYAEASEDLHDHPFWKRRICRPVAGAVDTSALIGAIEQTPARGR
jgi:flavin-dependent dehydrogenase